MPPTWRAMLAPATVEAVEELAADAGTLTTPVRNRPHVQVSADAPGEITLRVEYTLSRSTVTATLDLNFTIASLADATSITGDGNTSASVRRSARVPSTGGAASLRAGDPPARRHGCDHSFTGTKRLRGIEGEALGEGFELEGLELRKL